MLGQANRMEHAFGYKLLGQAVHVQMRTFSMLFLC